MIAGFRSIQGSGQVVRDDWRLSLRTGLKTALPTIRLSPEGESDYPNEFDGQLKPTKTLWSLFTIERHFRRSMITLSPAAATQRFS